MRRPSPIVPSHAPLGLSRRFLAGIHKWSRGRRRNKQKAGFPIKAVGKDRRRALPFHSCCRAVIQSTRSSTPLGPFRPSCALSVLPAPLRSFLRPFGPSCALSVLPAPFRSFLRPPVIPAVFSGNPQVVIVADGGTRKKAGFPIKAVGKDRRESLAFSFLL